MPHETLIDAKQLATALTTEDVVVADCRFSLTDPDLGRVQYGQGHVPGAFFFDLARDLSAPVEVHGGRHPLPDPNRLAERLEQAGVNENKLVVAYDDSRFAFAARFWWLLRYLGQHNVRVLNGGYKAWVSAGFAVSVEPPPPRRASFVPRPDSSLLATREEVRAHVAAADRRFNLVDAREPKRFRGEEEPIDPVAGRIPGARSFPWQDYTSTDGNAISETANQDRWSTLESKPTILYCGSGVTACVNALSLQAAGIAGARLYAGSFSDWCSYPELPIAVGPE